MAENSKIEWTDHTVNLWWGCSKVHTGCKNCYAESLSHRFGDNVWGENTKRKRIKSAFKDLDKYQKQASKENKKLKIFCGSMMDIFENNKLLINPTESYPDTNSLRFELFDRISKGKYDNLIFLFLTKRPLNIYNIAPVSWFSAAPKNVWFGTSISDQQTANIYVNELRKFSNNNLFLSVEPQIGGIYAIDLKGIDWVIQGGESGNKKRPFKVDWAKLMRDFCKWQKTPFFFKQIDKKTPIPEELMIREFPKKLINKEELLKEMEVEYEEVV